MNQELAVTAIRIYLDANCTPMADLVMADGVVETVQWNNAKARKEYLITGYTLIYDERPKRRWEEWS